MSATPQFLPAFTHEICRNLGNEHVDNLDPTRRDLQPRETEYASWLRRAYRACLRRRNLQDINLSSGMIESAIALVSPAMSQWEWLYAHLADEESRALLVQLLAFRALGARKVKLPLNTPAFWAGLRRVESLPSPEKRIPTNFLGWDLRRLVLEPLGVPITLYSTPIMAYVKFCLEQYRCRGSKGDIAAEIGDYVIDGGGCWGDTALYFAQRVGPNGRVYVFEFVPSSLEVLAENRRLNPALDARIRLVENALWNESGVAVGYEQNGPGTRVDADRKNAPDTAQTLSIDDLVAREQLPRLDFIKMDIEGAELPALRGAVRTLRRFAPKLSIAVYHRLEDFFEVPRYLDSLSLGYRFYLRHFTLHAEETMLFAVAPRRDAAPPAAE